MNSKIFVAVFGVLLAVQLSQQYKLRDDDLKDVVAALMNRALNTTRTSLERIEQEVKNLEQNKTEIEARVVAQLLKVADALNELRLNLINSLRDGATDDGKAVLDCIVANHDTVDAALEKFVTDLGTCAVDNTLIYNALLDMISQMNDLIAKTQANVDTLSSCSSDSTTCLVAFAQAQIAQLQNVREIIEADLVKAEQLVKDLLNLVRTCADTGSSELKESMQKVFNAAVVCIKS
ncbi:uncharacterized protein LOC126733933 [Anthonomus grandis grandis]|uniref:uncharacterized protein LOC126733933 n=1 Tax=Anthonomus grandis grandis TaxID=2921223 RepID=UPI0021659B8D|nr:uncharacterized protein LOC126733933 [Anthonomus grandis grandis]